MTEQAVADGDRRDRVAEILAHATLRLAAAGVETPRLDAEVMLAAILGCSRLQLILDADRRLDQDALARFDAMIARRATRVPVAHVIGRKEFYGREFLVDEQVLCPRPDTEILVAAALAVVRERGWRAPQIVDLCTGSGILAVTLALELPGARVVATDASVAALNCAARNAELHGVSIEFRQGDLMDALPPDSRFELVLSNPPYLSAKEYELASPELHHEPRMALVSEPGALDLAMRIVAGAPARLRPDGVLLIEVGVGQAQTLQAFGLGGGAFATAASVRDFSSIERVVVLGDPRPMYEEGARACKSS